MLILSLQQRDSTIHFVEDDIEAFVKAHPWLYQHTHRASGKGDVDTGAGTDISFIAGAALVRFHAVAVAVKNRIDDVVNTAQIRGFDLHHVATGGISEINNILVGVTPFIGHNFHAGTEARQLFGNRGQQANLIGLVTGIDRPFNVERQALRFFFQAGDVLRTAKRIHIEDQTDSAVYIDVQGRVVACAGALAQNTSGHIRAVFHL